MDPAGPVRSQGSYSTVHDCTYVRRVLWTDEEGRSLCVCIYTQIHPGFFYDDIRSINFDMYISTVQYNVVCWYMHHLPLRPAGPASDRLALVCWDWEWDDAGRFDPCIDLCCHRSVVRAVLCFAMMVVFLAGVRVMNVWMFMCVLRTPALEWKQWMCGTVRCVYGRWCTRARVHVRRSHACVSSMSCLWPRSPRYIDISSPLWHAQLANTSTRS
jgi:hypothetical protein